MSDTPRIYSSPSGGFSRYRRRRTERFRRISLFAFVFLAIYAYWISRDTHPMSEFIGAGHRFEAVVPRANLARHRLVESRVWEGIPQSWVDDWPDAMSDTHGLPEWVVGNLIGGGAIVVADDLSRWSDLVVASRMTRAGCLIERALRLGAGNSAEWAGGLRLRTWEKGGLYYAVRGRTLLVSPSREALVGALTLPADRRVGREAVRTALEEAGAEDARGTITLDPGSSTGQVVKLVRFAVRVEEGEAVLKLRAAFRPEVSAELLARLGETKPVTLAPPFEGPIALTANFGASIEETWRAAAEVLDVPWLTAEQWEEWRQNEDDRSPEAILTALLGPMGPSVRLTWQGTDMHEMAPTPVVVGSVSGTRERADDLLNSLPRTGDTRSADARVYYDAESDWVSASLMSGPSMSPTGRWDSDTFYFSSSALLAEAFFAEGRARTYPLTRPANFYVRVSPVATVQNIVQVGRDLAESGLLRDATSESFQHEGAVWLERASSLERVDALGTLNHEQIELELYVKCRPAS